MRVHFLDSPSESEVLELRELLVEILRALFPPWVRGATSAVLLLWAPSCTPVSQIPFRPSIAAPASMMLLLWAPIYASAVTIPFRLPGSASAAVAGMTLLFWLGFGVSAFARAYAPESPRSSLGSRTFSWRMRCSPDGFRPPVPKCLRARLLPEGFSFCCAPARYGRH